MHIDKVGFGQVLGAGMWLGKAKSSIPIPSWPYPFYRL